MHFLEYGVIKKKAEYRVALVYPNVYKAGNSNLGFIFAYNLINEKENFECERFFTDFPRSIETYSRLKDFDVIAFSCSFEMDYFTVYEIAHQFPEKIKILGGRTSYNPFPLKEVIDYFFVGDAEESLPEFLTQYENGKDLSDVQGVFTAGKGKARQSPLEYHPVYQPIQWGEYSEAFPRSFLLEISRGCSRKCQFCLVSHCIGKKRERSLDQIQSVIEKAEKRTKFETIVLIGPDSHSRLTDIIGICNPYRVSLPSLRVEHISEELLTAVRPETVTIAPETSERQRFSLNKVITDDDIIKKASLVSKYAKRMKLYFMVGLPGETENDLKEMVNLVKSVSKIIRTKVTVSPFVPKPHTPYANHQYNIQSVERSLKFLKRYIRISGPAAKQGFIQWVLSIGDERVGEYLKNRKYSAWKKLENTEFERKWKLIEI
ncbi:MAG: hypothetical protein AYK19_09540 [Theionarchaea archaeon DG-70-1]|nr:MAG: hypothetical protein AYK19_09540 [Theionarchaea archaeon DG-70-1]